MISLKKALCAMTMLSAVASGSASTFVGERTDFRDETIYFAMTTRFYDGDAKNNVCGWDHQSVQIANNDPDWRGDFKGLIEKLDYIKALGFTTVWITPIVQNCSGTDFHGYHAMDFSKVDLRYESRKEWGSAEDVRFQDLIDAAHAKGMKIVLDIVLNHTSNFGEAHFAELFYRSQDIRNQASVSASIIPNYDVLPANYNDLPGKDQYNARFPYLKNSDGTNKDSHNYWHHVGTGWNWDLPNRWYGQIAGDCVDLNTENPAVSKYLVECYGKFIEMGVDGFRIDTTGHISRLTFNTSFIPQFIALGEKYKDKRLNGAPFFMFGECCARFSDPTYRNQPNLSSYFYTWKSPQNLVDQWNWDETYWDNIFIREGDDSGRYGNMALCDAEPSVQQTSENVFMKNGAWHEPDYSDYSGFSIIDFPMHYNFNNAAAAVDVAKKGDKYYNDASYNVVYVDSHDYCPGPNDGTRFNGGTQQWAENLSLMFTFRGIPCIYYGSEVEFQAGKKVDAGGTDTPVKESGRAYFGHYIEGDVTAADFGEYNATGNAASTLNGDLSQHIIRLNKIRAAVPALRKGQYTFDGCSASGGFAFKRAYKDSYALVAVNGGATFTGVPAGQYVDVVTGQTYDGTSGKITVSAPGNKGQLRVLVKGWTGGKIGEDGKFIYTTSAVSHGGNPSFTDPGTTEYYTADDAPGTPKVSFDKDGGAFITETLTVTATLNDVSASGWIQIGDKARQNMTPSTPVQFTIGEDMAYGESVTVKWGAIDRANVEYTGQVTYRKADPNATITVYVDAPAGTNMYAWGKDRSGKSVEPNGPWPGKALSETVTVQGTDYYYVTFTDMDAVNVIFNKDGAQSGNNENIIEDTYYKYDGGTGCTKVDVVAEPRVKFSPNGGEFVGNVDITVTAYNATSAWYRIGDGEKTSISGNSATFSLGDGMAVNESVTVSWGATDGVTENTGSVVYTKVERTEPQGMRVYYDNSVTNWSNVNIHYWGGEESSNWPGVPTEKIDAEHNIWAYTVPAGTKGIIFNNGSEQTNNIENFEANHMFKGTGNRNWIDMGLYSSVVDEIITDDSDAPVEYYNLQGVRVADPAPGLYIKRQGNRVSKVRIL